VKPAELPPELHQSIESPLAWVREGAVNELSRLLQSGNPALTLAAYQALKPLADDDSRRVATAATQVIDAYEIQLKARAEEEEKKRREREQVAERVEAERLEAERLTSEKAEQERIARENAQQEGLAKERSDAQRFVITQAQLEIKKTEEVQRGAEEGEAERLAGATMEQERRAEEQTQPRSIASEKVEEQPAIDTVPALLTKPIMLSVLMTAIGWGIALFTLVPVLSSSANVLIADIFVGTIGGFITGVALARTEDSVRWKQMLLITVGWVSAWTLTDLIYLLSANLDISGGFAGSYDSWLILWGTSGSLGGLITGLTVWRKGTSVQWRQVFIVTAGWASFLIIGIFVPPDSSESLGFAIGGSIAGLIGAAIMFWQLSQAPPQT
jgi:hypothetical protein